MLPRRGRRLLLAFFLLLTAGILHLTARINMVVAEVLNPKMSGSVLAISPNNG
ncbi:hypothetical protein KKG41_00595 [Patescibacteria group bacterium]|nr:hypothetical protein [Patescibacteria group bacterium]MBU1890086.1 hypothetical protein [Patescibacteria group bacterium]